jgi:hypothetical protein
MSNNTYCFKLIYLIIYIPINREYLIFHKYHYITESEPFITHAQEEIPRKGGTISAPEREGREGFQPHGKPSVVYPSRYKYSKTEGVCQTRAVYDKLSHMLNNCITCKTKLIPIVYGRLDPEVLDMQDKGLLLVSLDKNRLANSYCPLCEQAYGDFTYTPQI